MGLLIHAAPDLAFSFSNVVDIGVPMPPSSPLVMIILDWSSRDSGNDSHGRERLWRHSSNARSMHTSSAGLANGIQIETKPDNTKTI